MRSLIISQYGLKRVDVGSCHVHRTWAWEFRKYLRKRKLVFSRENKVALGQKKEMLWRRAECLVELSTQRLLKPDVCESIPTRQTSKQITVTQYTLTPQVEGSVPTTSLVPYTSSSWSQMCESLSPRGKQASELQLWWHHITRVSSDPASWGLSPTCLPGALHNHQWFLTCASSLKP